MPDKMKTSNPAGYSGTPLARKLGYREGCRACVLAAPANYQAMLAPLPPGVVFEKKFNANVDLAHVFCTEKSDLARILKSGRQGLKADAALWVSWPKKSSRVPTTITEDTIRELALPLGFVDIKVCAVDDIWSGLKLVVRKELR